MPTQAEIAERVIPFSSLRYSTEAFIDYRIPGCAPKYNYALIGPGVSQNPDQPVSLREPHGFNLGGVSMPRDTTNPPHMHFTCEVFLCSRGAWQMHWGFNPERLEADIGEGDVCSVPTWIYRGFKNIGVDDGFMFTALGGNDTGGILWGPSTLEAAAREGVYLTEDYRIVDEKLGQKFTPGMRQLQPMTPEEIAALRVWSPAEMERRVVRFRDLRWSHDALLDAALPGCGGELAPVIGLGLSEDREQIAPVTNAHGFSIEWLRLPPDGKFSRHRLSDKQVIIVKRGELELSVEASDGAMTTALSGSSAGWDSMAMPADCWRTLRNKGKGELLAWLITAGDQRKKIRWSDDVVASAAAQGWAIDANGYRAPKRFVDRSQR
jgi:mannose-6-phosphate isomerase-like protein (cupin superfamily)